MLLSFDNVSLTYAPKHKILDNISFDFDDGDFCFLTVPSGAGKSSLLRLIYQAEKPSSGSIRLFGERDVSNSPLRRAEIRRKIGIVFQDFRLIHHLS